MSGDLEDFLKRAAERRQAKAAQQKQSTPQKRVPPQYSDRRMERARRPVPDPEVADAEVEVAEAEVVEAEVVPALSADNVLVAKAVTGNQDRSRQASRSGRRKPAKTDTAAPKQIAREEKSKATAVTDGYSKSTPYSQASATAGSQQSVGFSAEDLVALLKRPGGVQQALLLREILDRPEHRW